LQWSYNRDKLVTMISAEDLKDFLDWRHRQDERTLAEAFEELRRICEEEDYTLEIPSRQERPNPFPDGDEERADATAAARGW
jgi:hypothetical protein